MFIGGGLVRSAFWQPLNVGLVGSPPINKSSLGLSSVLPCGFRGCYRGNVMQAGASAAVLTEIGIVAIESALVGSAVVVLSAGIWGFKVLKRAL